MRVPVPAVPALLVAAGGASLGAAAAWLTTGDTILGVALAVSSAVASAVAAASLAVAPPPAPHQLVELQRQALAGHVALATIHEVKNALVGVVGFAQLTGERATDPAEVRRGLDAICRDGLRAGELLRGALALGHLAPDAPRAVDAGELVAGVVASLAPHAMAHHVELTCAVSPSVPRALATEAGVAQVVTNLVLNAVEAVQGATLRSVAVTVEPGEDAVEVAVTDSGPGVRERDIPRLFTPFFTTRRRGHGTGLGLWVSHTVATAMGARLSHLPAPGGGARFVLSLVVARPADETPAP